MAPEYNRPLMSDATPMMQQYRAARERAGDAVLLFRLGDFYEMFDQDARECAPLLDLTLTQRNGRPMCGVPYHAVSGYIARLLAAGRKVAVCEQTSPPGRGLVNREVVEIVTPGTVLDESLLDRSSNNYLAAVARAGTRIGLAYADLSTGEMAATSFPADAFAEHLAKELHGLDPREFIVPESLLTDDEPIRRLLDERAGMLVNRLPDWSFDPAACRARLTRQLGVANLKGYGLADDAVEIIAAGVLLDYLDENARRALDHLTTLTVYGARTFVGLDEATQRNLEILTNLQDGSRRFTLLEVLDQTRTAPGARKLRRRLLTPLLDRTAIERRLDAVESLYRDQVTLSHLREALGGVRDLERLAARTAMERAGARDLLGIRSSLAAALETEALFARGSHDHDANGRERSSPPDDSARRGPDAHGEPVSVLRAHAPVMRELVDLIARAIDEEPSSVLTEGGLIKRGFDAELDRLHGLKNDARGVLEAYLQEERAATGIASLKLRYNRIIGHFFEVTKSNLPLVPGHFIRRQSLVGGERYTTERLADLESAINDAAERIVEIERTLFLQVRDRVRARTAAILAVGEALSELDVSQSLAFASTAHGYTRPVLRDDRVLRIRDGRHPVVEAHLAGGAFVPNSVELADGGPDLVVLTGPNMAGKSTFLRQTALIALMAQVGAFVPAAEAEVGIVDAIFCRVGATDNLARGESTFLVEMNETANILRSAGERSLVIMDEVGRGTGTRDGLAIAWAVCLTILERVRARTLFATHFHELTGLAHPRLANLSMDVLEREGEVIFLKRVRPGPSANSYGLHVAKLAGLPDETLIWAGEVLARLVAGASPGGGGAAAGDDDTAAASAVVESAAGSPAETASRPAVKPAPTLFPASELVLGEIRAVRLDRTTPLEALNRLARWKAELDGGSG
jgi:DNA mismatch repair protein MutS